jgi:hypothetical protein
MQVLRLILARSARQNSLRMTVRLCDEPCGQETRAGCINASMRLGSFPQGLKAPMFMLPFAVGVKTPTYQPSPFEAVFMRPVLVWCPGSLEHKSSSEMQVLRLVLVQVRTKTRSE